MRFLFDLIISKDFACILLEMWYNDYIMNLISIHSPEIEPRLSVAGKGCV